MPKVKGTPKVRYNLTASKSPSYIVLFFHYRGKRLKCSVGASIDPAYWDGFTQRLKVNKYHPEYGEINDTLNEVAAAVVKIYKDTNLGNISPEDFRQELAYRMEWEARPEPITEKVPTLFEFIKDEFLPEQEKKARGTWQTMYSTFQHLKNYASEKKVKQLDYKDLNSKFFTDFKNWLYAPPRSHSINTAAKILRRVKHFLRTAEDRRYHAVTDYQSIKLESSKTSKFALSFDELERLYSLDLSENSRLEKVRDLFLIGAYTGLRFSDFRRIRPEHIEVVDGKTIINITTQKTGTPVSIPLFKIPLTLLQKYHFTAPTISDQKMNDYLKELGQIAGMTEKVVTSESKGGRRKDVIFQKWETLSFEYLLR